MFLMILILHLSPGGAAIDMVQLTLPGLAQHSETDSGYQRIDEGDLFL